MVIGNPRKAHGAEPTATRIVTANLDWATGARKDRPNIEHMLAANTVLGFQEAKNLRGPTSVAQLTPRPRVVLQDTRDQAHAGSGLVSRDVPLRHRREWLLGRSSVTLPRYAREAVIRVNGEPIHLISLHIPPHRAGYAAQERALERVHRRTGEIHRHGGAWAVCADWNMPIWHVAHVLYGRAYGTGIIGIVTSLSVRVSRHGIDRYGIRHHFTDHPDAWIDVIGVR